MPKQEYTLSAIKKTRSLEDLCKYDSIIRDKARTMIKCPDIAEDIVNDMYLKIHEAFLRGKIVDGGYVFMTLKNMITNHHKKNNRLDFGSTEAEAIIPESEDDSSIVIKEKIDQEALYDEIDRRVENLHWYEKSVLNFESSMSLLELSRQTGISYRSLNHTRDKIRTKLGIKPNTKKQ